MGGDALLGDRGRTGEDLREESKWLSVDLGAKAFGGTGSERDVPAAEED